MRDVNRGCIVKDSRLRRYWKPLLMQWCQLVEQYCELGVDDAPYWYGETANTGILASACFKCGGAAVVEAKRPKGHGNNKWTGRGDLYIIWKKSTESVEAKFRWHSLWSPYDISKIAKEHLSYALRNVEEIDIADNSEDLLYS